MRTLGRDDDEPVAMEKQAAEEVVRTAKAEGVFVSDAPVLQPGPLCLTRVRKAAMSTKSVRRRIHRQH